MRVMRCLSLLAILIACKATHSQQQIIPVSYSPIQGAPFDLTIERRFVSTSSDGTTKVFLDTSRVARDRAGRQRFEHPVSSVRAESTVSIFDVVTHTSIALDLNAKTALVGFVPVGQARPVDISVVNSAPPVTPANDQTLLGNREIVGLEAWGQRTLKPNLDRQGTPYKLKNGSTSINDAETWYSTHYGIPLLRIQYIARGVTDTSAVVTFSSAEPDPALFQIPPGFTRTNRPAQPGNTLGTIPIGGDVSAPILLKSSPPELLDTSDARKLYGNSVVHLIVDENGVPQDLKIQVNNGPELDQKAIEAVKQYRFKPALRNGIPVKVELDIEVNFQVF